MDGSIAILGRQPELGVAELESLYGSERVEAVGTHAARLHIDACMIDFSRLGGTVKLCKVLTVLDTQSWNAIERFLVSTAPQQAAHMPEGKMHLGMSVYDLDVPLPQLLATGLKVKKAIHKDSGRTVRLVPNKTPDLNAAQVIHNKLTGLNGWELIFIGHDGHTVIAQTVAVQDIGDYTVRDRGRPKRDPRVGMLPPKLAQIIINLAVGSDEFDAIQGELQAGLCLSQEDSRKMRAERQPQTVLDPFCGTGVILQEALLIGYNAYGTDTDLRMVDYSCENLEWLTKSRPPGETTYRVTRGDATTFHWEPPVGIVASETYLGRPFTTSPAPALLEQTLSEVNLILKKFLRNIHSQLAPGMRLCLAIPAWQTRPGQFRHLPLIDQLEELGYNQVRFEHVRRDHLLYYRADQTVARELLVITRK